MKTGKYEFVEDLGGSRMYRSSPRGVSRVSTIVVVSRVSSNRVLSPPRRVY